MNLLQRFVKRLFFNSDQRYLLEMYNHGYIFESGFMKSIEKQEVVFQDGSPAPWFNYSFLDFMLPRLDSSFSIFEYGLGNSTKYFNSVLSDCYGVEHDKSWYSKVMNTLETKSNYYLCDDEEYVKAIQKAERQFDIVVVDGLDREGCIRFGLNYLSDTGILILDDSEREIYKDSISFIKSKGFKELKISGLKALGRHYSATSVFYRMNNCLKI